MDMSLLSWGPDGWGDEMLRGAIMTLAISACSFALGLLIGTVLAAMKLSGSRLLRFLADFYTTTVRGIPELLIIYLVFFGGGVLLRNIASGVFGYEGYVDLPLFVTGMICIGASAAAYNTEVIRGAVLAVPVGMIEAAKAVGMSRSQRFLRVLAPQTLRYALPGLGNVWQVTLKETSLISVIGLVEIMRQSAIAAGSTREPFTFYLTAAILFLALASLSNKIFEKGETWANRGVRRATR